MASKYISIFLVFLLSFSLHQKSNATYYSGRGSGLSPEKEKIVKRAIYHYGAHTKKLQRRPAIKLPGSVKPCKCRGFACNCRLGRRPCGRRCRTRRARRALRGKYGYGRLSKRPKSKYSYGYGRYGLKKRPRYRKRPYSRRRPYAPKLRRGRRRRGRRQRLRY